MQNLPQCGTSTEFTAALNVRRDNGGTQDRKAVGTGRKETSGEGDTETPQESGTATTGVRCGTVPKKL